MHGEKKQSICCMKKTHTNNSVLIPPFGEVSKGKGFTRLVLTLQLSSHHTQRTPPPEAVSAPLHANQSDA